MTVIENQTIQKATAAGVVSSSKIFTATQIQRLG